MGQSESEICEMLGDPVEIAAQCAAETSFFETKPPYQDRESGIFVDIKSVNLVFETADIYDMEVRIERRGIAPEHEDEILELTGRVIPYGFNRSEGILPHGCLEFWSSAK